MSADDLETIPTLNDIVIAGDPSKAVVDNENPAKHEANIQDLSSTGHFNALFEPITTVENSDANDESATENDDTAVITVAQIDTTPSETNSIDTPVSEIVDGILLTEDDELTVTNDMVNLNHEPPTVNNPPETDNEPTSTPLIPQIDIDELVENVLLEMMPHLEIQIRAQILSSLAKHLPEAIIKYDTEQEPEKDLTP